MGMMARGKLWVTRPRQYGERTARALAERGYEALVYPLLEYHLLPPPKVDVGEGDGLIFTSSFAVEAFHRAYGVCGGSVFCVGEGTARVAESLGFVNVTSGGGDVEALRRCIVGQVSKDVRLWHFAASETVGDLSGALRGAGFSVELVVLYETRGVGGLDAELGAMLGGGEISGVLLYSPKTARVFVDLVGGYDLGGVFLFCLSDNVAGVVGGLGCGYVGVAGEMVEGALLDLVSKKL